MSNQMDIAYIATLQKENSNLKDELINERKEHDLTHDALVKRTQELDRTRKALDVAVDALKNATEYLGNQEPLVDVMATNLHIDLSKAIEQIKELTKGE